MSADADEPVEALPASVECEVRALARLRGVRVEAARDLVFFATLDPDRQARAARARAADATTPPTPLDPVEAYAVRDAVRSFLRDDDERAKYQGVLEEIRADVAKPGAADTPDEFEMEAGRQIRWTKTGVSLIAESRDGEHEVAVIDGRFRPLRTLIVDGDPEPYREVDMGGDEPLCGRANDIMERLERGGRVLSHRLARDVVGHLYRHFGGPPIRTRATYGIYTAPDGRLEECTEPTPTKPEQIEAHAEIRRAIEFVPSAKDLRDYFELDIVGRFSPYETLPLRGASVLAPFNPVLRARRAISGHIFSEAKETGLGKTLLGVVYSEKLYGRSATSADAVRSAYRFPATADAACVPQAFSEASDLEPQWFEPAFKVMPESWSLTKRGRSTLEMVSYNSRATFFFSGNSFPLRARPHLVRTIRISHDPSRLAERAGHKDEVDGLVVGLRPVGPFVARCLMERFPTESALLGELGRLESEVKRAAALLGRSFVDLRRAQTWAAIILGLEAWELAAAKLGVTDIPSLTRREFFEDTIARVEESTFESELTALAAFRAFRAGWKAKNTVRATTEDGHGYTEVRGRGTIWQDGHLEVKRTDGRPQRIPGEFVTQTVLDEYRQQQALADLRISSLAELARLGLRELGLSERQIEAEAFERDSAGKLRPKRFRFANGERDRVAFVPADGGDTESDGASQMVLRGFVVPEVSPLDEEWLNSPWSQSGPRVVPSGPKAVQSEAALGPPGTLGTTGGPGFLPSENSALGPRDHQNSLLACAREATLVDPARGDAATRDLSALVQSVGTAGRDVIRTVLEASGYSDPEISAAIGALAASGMVRREPNGAFSWKEASA